MEHKQEKSWQQLPADQFALLGMDTVAYLKPKLAAGDTRQLFAIHSADGTEVAVVDGRDRALATIIQNDLEPACVH